jgi:hypothetical protein
MGSRKLAIVNKYPPPRGRKVTKHTRLVLCVAALLFSQAAMTAYEDLVFICKVHQYSNVSLQTVENETYIDGETGTSEMVWVIGAGQVHLEDIGNTYPCRFSESLILCADPAMPSMTFTLYRQKNAFVVQGYWQGADDGKEQFFVFAGKCEQIYQ